MLEVFSIEDEFILKAKSIKIDDLDTEGIRQYGPVGVATTMHAQKNIFAFCAFAELALCLVELGRRDEADRWLTRTTTSEQVPAEAAAIAAEVMWALGRSAEAIDYAGAAIAAMPTIVFPEPHGRTMTPLPPRADPETWNASTASRW